MSAMKTRAPLFRALMSIFGSAGPVDLDAPVDEVGGRLRDAPPALPNGGRLWQVVERRSGSQGGPPLPTPLQELEPAWPERSLQAGDKAQRVRCEDALRVRWDGRRDLHAIRKRQCHPTTATRPRGVVHVSSRLDRVTAPSPVTIRRASAASSRSGRSSPISESISLSAVATSG